ncbi:MAG: glycosyltransferase [Acidobacteriia bacterium]|nr:glycosyltransferase [Terriglobia bacterium]
MIAKEVAQRGNLHVTLIVGDHGQPHVEHRHAVVLYSWIGRAIWGIPAQEPKPIIPAHKQGLIESLNTTLRVGISAIKRKHSQAAPLGGQVGPYTITQEMISIYDEVDADIYVVPGNSQFSGEAAFYCRQRGKKYVFLSGSDYDYSPEYKTSPDQYDMYSVPHALKLYAIENAALHIVQNERQANLLRDEYGRSSVIIKNPIDLKPLFPRNATARTILWVGKSDERTKRPSMMLELARQLPQYRFVMVMTFTVKETHDRCIKEASTLSNVTLLERIPFSQIERFFADARLHVNTSTVEGFPNTFLQAAKYGVPTLSIQVDPGEMLSKYGCGLVCAGDFEQLRDKVQTAMTNDVLYSILSRQSEKYVRESHDKNLIIPKYEQAFTSVLLGAS